jgi:hypothetical protein
LAQSARGALPPDSLNEQLLAERKHFVECLACVYSPGWWLSYTGALYFQYRNEAQAKQLEEMKAARSSYVALTNQETRHALAAKLMAQSGISESWQKKLLLPYSATNQTLTPTIDRLVHLIPSYKLLQTSSSGDALIQDGASTYFVLNYGRGADDAACTNALLIR